MLVKDVTTSTVHTINKNDSFREIITLLDNNNISGAPVVDAKGQVIGIISEKDLLYNLLPSEEEYYKDIEYYTNHERIEKEANKITKLTAKDLMSKDIISIEPDAHILHACALMLLRNIRRLPVMENGKLVGIVTTRNIYKNFLKMLVK